MQGYQFAHIETWSVAGATGSGDKRKATRGKSQRTWSAAEIFDEAERVPGSCEHVDPWGSSPDVWPGSCGSFAELRAAHAAAASVKESFDYTHPKTGAMSVRSRALRRDARSLYTAVFSLPVDTRSALADPMLKARCIEVLGEALGHEAERIERLGGTHAMSVLHWDEGQVHAHFYGLDSARGRVNHLHPGTSAKERFMNDPARQLRLDKKRLNRGGDLAYRRAMRAWQDDLHAEVFGPAGLLRFGPGRERLSRADWQQAKQAAAERAEDTERQKHLDERVADLQEFEAAMAELRTGDIEVQRAWNDELEARSREIDEAQAGVGARWRATIDREVEQEAREARIERREADAEAREVRLSAEAEAVAKRERTLREREVAAAEKEATVARREAEAEAAMAVIDAVAEGAADLVEVDGEPRLRPSPEPAKAAVWTRLQSRIGAAPTAARRMLTRVRDRLDRLRPVALEEARRELQSMFERAAALRDGAQQVYAELTGMAERLPPEDRRKLEEIRGQLQRAAGSKAILARDLRATERDGDR